VIFIVTLALEKIAVKLVMTKVQTFMGMFSAVGPLFRYAKKSFVMLEQFHSKTIIFDPGFMKRT